MSIMFAKSLSGHDKNHIYYIWKEEQKQAYLVNGDTHPYNKAKKKNKKHYQIIKTIPEHIIEKLKETEHPTDEMIRVAIRNYKKSIEITK